jgi:hypothetical protein
MDSPFVTVRRSAVTIWNGSLLRPFSIHEDAYLAENYRLDKPLAALTRAFNVHFRTSRSLQVIHARLVKLGLHCPRPANRLTDAEKARIDELRAIGCRVTKIGLMMGRTHTTISTYLKGRKGIKMPSNGSAYHWLDPKRAREHPSPMDLTDDEKGRAAMGCRALAVQAERDAATQASPTVRAKFEREAKQYRELAEKFEAARVRPASGSSSTTR